MDQILICMDVQHLLVSLSICRLVVRTMGNDQKESIMNNRRLQDYIVYNIYIYVFVFSCNGLLCHLSCHSATFRIQHAASISDTESEKLERER